MYFINGKPVLMMMDGIVCSGITMTHQELYPDGEMIRNTGLKVLKC